MGTAKLGVAVMIAAIAGTKEEQTESNNWRIPKIELIGNLNLLLESDRLQINRDMDLVSDLTDELNKFSMKPPRVDPNDPEAWREGQFDDLVFAVAVAAWRANHYVPRPGHMSHERARYVEKRLKEIGQAVI